MNSNISIIIPVFNERSNIQPLAERIDDALGGFVYEVLFVDDGSKDGTTAAIEALAAKYPLKLLKRRGKRGLASAVADGITATESRYLAVMDADLQHPPELLPQMLNVIIEKRGDIAVASRYSKGGGVAGWGLWRRLISKGASLLSHLLLPKSRQTDDPMSGYFAFNRDVVESVKLEPVGYKILLEIMSLGKFRKVEQVPYTFDLRQAEESKLGMRQQLEYLRHLLSLLRRSGELVRFLRFGLVGISGVAVNMGLLWFLTDMQGFHYLFSSVISVEIAIISNYTLNNFFTFADRRQPGVANFFRRMVKFNVASIIGLLINMSVLVFFTEVAGLYYLVSNMLGILAATSWNYLVNNWWTWQ